MRSERERALLRDALHSAEVDAPPCRRGPERAGQVRTALAPVETLVGEGPAMAALALHGEQSGPEELREVAARGLRGHARAARQLLRGACAPIHQGGEHPRAGRVPDHVGRRGPDEESAVIPRVDQRPSGDPFAAAAP